MVVSGLAFHSTTICFLGGRGVGRSGAVCYTLNIIGSDFRIRTGQEGIGNPSHGLMMAC